MLLDMNYTRHDVRKRGPDLLLSLQTLGMPVVVMTAWGSIDNAVECGAARATTSKPWDNARLMSILATQIELGRALRHAQRLETSSPQMIAESAKMKPILR
jgi:DNA-binding NtrC family response regulator